MQFEFTYNEDLQLVREAYKAGICELRSMLESMLRKLLPRFEKLSELWRRNGMKIHFTFRMSLPVA